MTNTDAFYTLLLGLDGAASIGEDVGHYLHLDFWMAILHSSGVMADEILRRAQSPSLNEVRLS